MKTEMKTAVIFFLLTSICCAKINVRKKRAWVVDSLYMEEELSGPFPYKLGALKIEKSVLEEYFAHGQGIDEDPKGILSVAHDGSVYALGKVDYEQYKKLMIRLTKENSKVAVDVVVVDVNDHAPVFNKEVIEISVDESTPQGEHLVTLVANDNDQAGTANSMFSMRIVSVSPSTPNVEFFIDQNEGDMIGKISFKGCLDYEEAQKYTILVEAKDHGEKVQLSSTSTVILNIVDKNNHLPEFTGMTGVMGLNAQKVGDIVCRLQVRDEDSPESAAWRVTYSLQGEDVQHFDIQTDNETNEGLITVTKPLTSEQMFSLSLKVSVTNEEPFFSCRVKGRPKSGLWDVYYSSGWSRPTTMFLPISAIRKDASDPSEFSQFIQVGVMDRLKQMKTGPMLEVEKLGMCLSEKTTDITAVDPELYSSAFHYELMGDTERKWKLQSNYGTSVKLIKENTVRAGDHKLTLKISGSQGQFSLQTLSVHVCDCKVSANCKEHRDIDIKLNITAITVITASTVITISILLMLVILLKASKVQKSFLNVEATEQSCSPDTEGNSMDSGEQPLLHTDSNYP